MKRLFKAIIAGLVITAVFSLVPFEKECKAISEEVLRIHILANSDSEEDQRLKIITRDAVLNFTDSLFDNADSKQEAINITKANLKGIEEAAKEALRENGSFYNVNAQLTDMYFDTRYYKDIAMPSGNYTALRLTIGEGKGKNWWCVMYPSLCLYTSSEAYSLKEELTENQYDIVSDSNTYNFKFKLLEYFNYFCNLFR